MAVKKLVVPIALVLTLFGSQPSGKSASDLVLRLQSTRDALIAQERDLRKSYDDVTRQIDALRQRQSLLDSYLTQTRYAIRDVDRAMGSAQ